MLAKLFNNVFEYEAFLAEYYEKRNPVTVIDVKVLEGERILVTFKPAYRVNPRDLYKIG